MSQSSFNTSSPLADPTERSLWLREAVRPVRVADATGTTPSLVLRGRFRAARGGEAFACLCVKVVGRVYLPLGVCLIEETSAAEAVRRGDIGLVDFAMIYGIRAWLGLLAGAFAPGGADVGAKTAAAPLGAGERSRLGVSS